MIDKDKRVKFRQWVLGITVTILLTLATIANTWAIIIFKNYDDQRKDIMRRLDNVEKTAVTEKELEEINCRILDKIDARFDKFELYFQTKYKITPK